MADSVTQICNMALSHIGLGKNISDYDTETSEEAKACRQFYETARDYCLRDFPWAFAQKRFDLSQVETLTTNDPDSEWTYSYTYPTDCLMIHRIHSGTRNDTRQSRVSYEIINNSGSKLIYSDTDDARITYTAKVTNVQVFPADFTLALSYKLAELICPRITAGDPFQIKKNMIELYTTEVDRARANDKNEVQNDEEPDSELVNART